VTCTAVDRSSNAASCSFTVTVVDSTPPIINCSSNITAQATGPGGAAVQYVASASDPCGLRFLDCRPPSGSTFPIGVTTVTCVAADLSGNSNRCSFTISVVEPNRPPVCVVQVPCLLNFPNDTRGYAIALDDARACLILDGSGSSDPDGDPLTYNWNFGFTTTLTPGQEPGPTSTRSGSGSGTVKLLGNSLAVDMTFSGLSANAIAMHFHGPAGIGTNAGVLYGLQSIGTLGATAGTIHGTVNLVNGTGGFTIAQQLAQLYAGLWYVNIHTVAFGSGEIRGQVLPNAPALAGPVVTNCFDVGCHSIVLSVGDGRAFAACETNICVISASDAIDRCILLVDGSNVGRKNKRPLIANLKGAAALFDEGHFVPAVNQLEAFQRKVRAQIAPTQPAEAAAFIACTQQIIDAVTCAATLTVNGVGAER